MKRRNAMPALLVMLAAMLMLALPGYAADMRVRSADHEGYSRLVFDWSQTVDYQISRDGGDLLIRFDSPAEVDFGALAQRPLARAANPRVEAAGEGVTVRLAVDPAVTSRSFRNGNSVVLDLRGGPVAAAARLPFAPVPSGAVESAALVGEADDLTRIRRQTEAVRDAAMQQNQAAAAAARRAEAARQAAQDQAQAAAAEAAAQAAADEAAQTALKALRVTYQPLDDGYRLHFHWDVELAAAVFKRGDGLWVVFERLLPVEDSGLTPHFGQDLRSFSAIETPGATVLRFAIDPALTAIASRNGPLWQVDMRRAFAQPRNPVEPVRRNDPALGPVAFANVGEAGPRLNITDPSVGDQLIVLPAMPSSTGVASYRQFAEFGFLATAQGVAVERYSDAVVAERFKNGIAVGGGQAMRLADGAAVGDAAQDAAKPLRLLDFAAWRGDRQIPYAERLQPRLRALAQARDVAEIAAARRALARFYLANDNHAEALGVLALMQDADPSLAEEPEFIALRGIARFKGRRFADAAADLALPTLDSEPEAALWRAAAAQALGQPRAALEHYQRGTGALSLHETEQRAFFQLTAARAALALGNHPMVERELAELSRLELDADAQAAARLLAAQLDEAYGDPVKALDSYRALAQAPSRRIRAQAGLGAVNLELTAGALSAAEAIDRLEAMRFAWRGDDFEQDLLKRLGGLYVDDGDYRKGLNAWRQAVSYFPRSPQSKAIAADMSAVFQRLFLGGEADAMPPVTALALYYDFRELTPLGPDGDAMIRRLSERMVEVDLLDRAAGLLEHQVKYRLEGTAQAAVAARLAMIYLLDGKPEQALGALRATRQAVIPLDVLAQRKRIEARALIDLARYEEAEVVLDRDDSREALLLRSEIFWGAKRWSDLIANARQLLGDRWRLDAPLTMDERRQVLRYAIALAMSGREAELAVTRRNFRVMMSGGPLFDAFDVITNEADRANTDLRAVTADIAGVDRLEAFLSSYRNAFKSGPSRTDS